MTSDDEPPSQRYRPASLDEAVDHLRNELTDDQREELRAMEEADLPLTHFALGMYVRNNYDLGALIRPWHIPPTADGHWLNEPDGVSAAIIHLAWKRLREP